MSNASLSFWRVCRVGRSWLVLADKMSGFPGKGRGGEDIKGGMVVRLTN